MEILFFINGMLSLIVVYIAYLNFKLKKETKDLHQNLNETQYQYTRSSTEIKLNLIDLNDRLESIDTQLNTDEYKSISGLNQQVSGINELALAANRKVDALGREHEKQNSVLFTEIQQLKNNIKGLNQDPNILDR